MLLEPGSANELTREEQRRLDDLLSAARRFHYSAFIFSGLSLALVSIDTLEGFELPIGGVVVPTLQTIVGLYLLVLVFVLVSERLFAMAYPFLKMDKRRPPFAWIALGSRDPSIRSVTFWLVVPVLICAIATATLLDAKDVSGFTLSFAGVLFILLPRTVGGYWYLIGNRLDHRDGAATFSIWLLYWYRLVRDLWIIVFMFAPVVAVVPKWRGPVWKVTYPFMILGGGVYILRTIAAFPFVYRLIDRLGKRFGFPVNSKHYD